jgi:hypothetical protein
VLGEARAPKPGEADQRHQDGEELAREAQEQTAADRLHPDRRNHQGQRDQAERDPGPTVGTFEHVLQAAPRGECDEDQQADETSPWAVTPSSPRAAS